MLQVIFHVKFKQQNKRKFFAFSLFFMRPRSKIVLECTHAKRDKK